MWTEDAENLPEDEGEDPSDAEMIAKARARYGREGSIEIDDNAVVSRGGDPGAYVQAWVWVYFSDGEERK